MAERIHLTPRQIQLLAPQVSYVSQLRQQAVRVQEELERANVQLVRECEMVYPAWTQGCRFIASEGVIEIPTTGGLLSGNSSTDASKVSQNTVRYPPLDPDGASISDSEGPE